MNKQIKYRAGYKYQLAEDYVIEIGILGYDIDTEYIKITPSGTLTIKKGYAWDGCSGPTKDDKTKLGQKYCRELEQKYCRDNFL